MSQAKRKLDRVLAFALSLLMIFGMMPINSVYAIEPNGSVLETNIGDIEFVVNEATEFTVTSIANDDANAMVKGYFDFSNPSAIEKLEYYETTEGYEGWYELTGEFGPSTGFPIIDGTSKFRVTFNAVGEYSVSIALKDVNDESIVYCSTAANVKVNRNASVLTTDIASKNFVVYEATEFTFTSVANDDADKLVKGYFDFSDPSAIEKLEYYETAEGMQGWYELNGAFGPATGFPVINGTSKFRVTFNKVGDYTVEVSLKQVSDDAVLSKVKANVSVAKTNITDITISPTSNKYTGEQFALATLNGEIKSGDIVTYTIKGDANSYAAIPNASAVGNYEVTITVDRGSNYNVYSQTVTSSIELGELELGAIKVQGLEGVYTGVAQNAVSVTGQGDYSLQYKLGNDDWSDTIPTVTDAGSYTVQVKATKTNYNDKEVSVDKAESAVYPFNVYIAKAEQKDFAFSNKTPSPLAYKGTFENKADGGQSGGTITYEVVDGNEYVSVDQNGKITALKAGGNATIKATRAGNNNYNAVSDTYAISTIMADQTDFAFEKAEYTVQYGTDKLTVVAKGGQSNGAVTYEVLNGDIGTIASADNKGNVTLVSGKKGEMTIKATLAGGENYNDISAEVTVKVLTNDFSDKVSVDTCPTTGWYTETVSITPAAGYKISTSAQFDAEWKDSITFATEGKNSPDDVFLLEEATGYISEAIAIEDIYIDKTNPTALNITYSNSIRDVILETISFGFYNAEMKVTLTATDLVSKVDHFVYKIGNGAEVTINKVDITYSGNDGEIATASFNIPANLSRSKITLTAFDTSGRCTTIIGDKTLVVDDVKPVVSVSYDNNDDTHNSYFKKFDTNKPTRTATITIAEENFFIDDLYKEVYINDVDGNPVAQGYNYLTITVGKRLNNEANYTYTDVQPVFTKDGDVYKATVEFVEDADYTFDVVFYDYSMNKNASVDYGTSVAPTAFTVDNIAPVLDITYDDINAAESQTNAGYYTGKRVATFKVTEHNFDPSELVFTVFGGSDVQNNTVNATQMATFVDVLRNIANWSQNGDEYTATIEFDTDANYAIELNYSDLANNAAEKETSSFCLDNTKPYVVTDAEISYSASILDTILNAITFGFYNAEMEVTITAYDETAGIDFFTYSYTVSDGGHSTDTGKTNVVIPNSDITFTEGGKKATATFKIPEQFRGYVSFTATDKSGKTSELFTDEKCIVVDNVAPGVNVTYGDDDEVKNGNYFNVARTATITISADNFFADYLYCPIDNIATNEDYLVITKGTRLDNETEYTYTREKPVFTKDGDVYKATIDFDMNADYKFDIKYTDKSHNVYDSYQEDIFTVDKIKPNVKVVWDNNESINEVENRKYFDGNRMVTITVVEHNFVEKDFTPDITAKDSAGNKVSVNPQFGIWTHNGDEHVLTVTFTEDANYTFGYTCIDLAGNPADTYVADEFTIDTKKPYNLKVDYAGDEKQTAGYYDDKVTVTISADDDTSGIAQFIYSYVKAEGVSDVNAGMTNVLITENIRQNGKTFSADFEIPKEALDKNNQFNGYVEFKTIDIVEKDESHKETANIVVDNIPPVVDVTYSQPITEANNIKYYAGNIDAKVVITEANFNSDDVVVKVNDNKVTDVSWKKDNADTNTGTFTITGDGDYIVTVEYTDRSENKMETYTSNRLTIDTKAPVVSVSNIKNNSANKDEKFGFTITAKDINLDSTTFKPTLTAVVLNENGTFSTKTISLGDMATVKVGEEYSFTIDNLADDAIYTLVCTVEDMSDNKYEKVILSDGKEYESVRFSINRNGSTYGIEENTADLIEKYYVQNVTDNVVIIETNADVLSEYKVTVNGKELAKDTDYTVTEVGGNGSWMKYTYSVNKELFANEGEYKIVVSSKDKAENDAFSDVKDATVNFVVDRTAPIVTITGLANDGRYQTDVQTVTLIPTDDGGALKSLIVRTVDEDGKQLKEILNLAGEELEKALADGAGRITFEIEKGLYQNVQIICDDCAVDEEGKTNVYDVTIKNVSVDANAFIVNFWANKPLRWGSIAGVIALAAFIIFFIFWKRKKKEEQK